MAPMASILLVSTLSLTALWMRLACTLGGNRVLGSALAAGAAGERLLTITLVGRSVESRNTLVATLPPSAGTEEW